MPKRCAYCGKVISSDRLRCHDCEKSLPEIKGTVCFKCGRGKDDCSCKNAEMYFTSLAAPFYFEGNVRKGVHAFKFRNAPDNAHAYGFEMSETVRQRYSGVEFDFITEVPMTEKSIKARGYNQCELLAKEVSLHTGIEYKPNVLVKLYETKKQHGLTYHYRKGNLTGVFDVPSPDDVRDKTVLVCDDISTSGETLNECAKMLWLYGAKEIYGISIALTKSHKKNKKRGR